ncbi:MAG: signal transduction histidine kinase [Luteibaculaceae bacterium]|jgi:signal transduction histidine kinase
MLIAMITQLPFLHLSMDKLKWITILLIGALVGLLALQVYWIQQNYAIRDQEYRRAVTQSLAKVGGQIDQLQLGMVFRKKIRRSGTVSDTVYSTPGGGQVAIRIEQHVEAEENHPLFDELLSWDIDLSEGAINDFLLELSRGGRPDRWQLISPEIMDSLIKSSFKENGVQPSFEFRAMDRNGNLKMASVDFDFDLNGVEKIQIPILKSRYLGDYRGILEVAFPKLRREVYLTMWPQFLLSIGLVAVLVFVFYSALRTIYTQKRLSEVKSDFINNMTHELKTPISTIRLAAEALVNPALNIPEEMSKKYLRMIGAEGKRLTHLVDEVLNSAQLENGGFELHKNTFQWEGLREALEEKFVLIVGDRGGELRFLGTWEGSFFGDFLHISNAVSNLVDNAIKYGGSPPVVQVNFEALDGDVFISVGDNGKGIKKEEHNRIFDNLYRVGMGNTHDVKGFGIGLFYTRRIMEEHGGKVELVYSSGIGSSFCLSFKKAEDEYFIS